MAIDWNLAIGLISTSILAALIGLLTLSVMQRRQITRQNTIFADRTGGTSFLFDGETLIDATPDGRALLSISAVKGTPWTRLLNYLGPRFPTFQTCLVSLPQDGIITLSSADDTNGPLLLRAEYRSGLIRISLFDPEETTGQASNPDAITLRATQDELSKLRATLSAAPLPIWREDGDGKLTWANAAYLYRAIDTLPPDQELTWPLPRLFSDRAETTAQQRHKLATKDGSDNWFEIQRFSDGPETVAFALPVDALVQAEKERHAFTQTLVKTFAHLPIGLAIFDRQRQLILFNPALLGLSGLQPDFLSLRPTLFAFLDAMRDCSMIPEPKDYRSWRRQMAALEEAASTDHFEEIWNLPSGLTYRVVGRPYPNGAMALLFEDISTEMSRIRRFRADLELGQAVLDLMTDAVAVFSATGTLVMVNTAYADLWGHDPATAISDENFRILCNQWREKSAPSVFWDTVEAAIPGNAARQPLFSEVRLLDGRPVTCTITPLAGGATLARFTKIPGNNAVQPGLTFRTDRKQA